MTRLLLTVPEATEALDISRNKLYQLITSGAVAASPSPLHAHLTGKEAAA